MVLSHLGTQEPGICGNGDPGGQNLRAPCWSLHEQFLSPQGRGSRAAAGPESWTITRMGGRDLDCVITRGSSLCHLGEGLKR